MAGKCLVFLLLLAVVDQTAADSSSLAQLKLKSNRNGLYEGKSRRAYLDDLLQRTESMMKSGVTPEVVNFAKDTILAITDTIIPVISEEHDTDQLMLHELWKGFVRAEADFLEGAAEIERLRGLHQHASQTHGECRDDESDLCQIANACDAELGKLWKEVVDLEKQIEDVDTEIHTEWCEENNNRTKTDFRTDQVESFVDYVTLVPLVEEAWAAYLAKLSECRKARAAHHAKRDDCHDGQTDLETATCLSAVTIQQVIDQYNLAFGQAETAYDTAEAGIRVEEADRKVEFSTLQMILCLLDNINEMVNGSAAAAGTDYVKHLEACHEDVFDTAHLDVDYNDTPPKHELPAMPNYPCTAAFLEQEYGALPYCTESKECIHCAGMPVTCDAVLCAMDLCSDGAGRRKIGDDCCACPSGPVPVWVAYSDDYQKCAGWNLLPKDQQVVFDTRLECELHAEAQGHRFYQYVDPKRRSYWGRCASFDHCDLHEDDSVPWQVFQRLHIDPIDSSHIGVIDHIDTHFGVLEG